ncbi:leucine-rich repeat protein [Hujiaoplasma nucleasis]|uniref:Leucine-rich repeat protein n=1 Tax=Hujiaoplasma nucleasis TaxID=2725268 RepID=A0A7L6N0B2_9MOLU|nr:leucine-rich repeat protein [Hujiaoplasma nucleasis]QLY39673.1 leucine-rich repeat protein [Hujiaoplasma nucleasis]
MKKLLRLCCLILLTMALTACDGFPGVTDLTGDTNVVDTSTELTGETTTESIIEINERIYEIYELAVTSSAFTESYEDWLESIRGPQGLPGENGKEVQLQVFEGYIQWQHVGDETWSNLISLLDLTGSDGREVVLRLHEGFIEWQYSGDETWLTVINLQTIIGDMTKVITLQVFEGYIQWQYLGDTTWNNLLELSTMIGSDGHEVVLQVANGFVQWQYIGDETWNDLLDLSTMTGSDGNNGKKITLQVLDGFDQWQYIGDSTWNNLLDLSTMTGSDGSDGQEIILQVADGYVQWKYEAENEWHNLIELLTLVGTNGIDGANGLSAYEILEGDEETVNNYMISYPTDTYNFKQIPDTSVYVTDLLSLYNIFMGDVIAYGGNFYSNDMTRIIRYMTNDPEVTISSTITKIGSYAFFGNINVDMVYIPLNVTEIGIMAFGEMGIEHIVEIMTEYSVQPAGWSDYAFFDNVIVHWANDLDYPIINENTETLANISIGGDSIIYEFVPQTTGYYEIYSVGTYDTYAYLYDSYFDYIIDSDDDGEASNFYINYYFEAGVTYYIQVEFWSTIDTGTFSLFVMNVPA